MTLEKNKQKKMEEIRCRNSRVFDNEIDERFHLGLFCSLRLTRSASFLPYLFNLVLVFSERAKGSTDCRTANAELCEAYCGLHDRAFLVVFFFFNRIHDDEVLQESCES